MISLFDQKQVYDVAKRYILPHCHRLSLRKCNVGSSDVFQCNSCKIVIHRDYNGTRNILLKHLHPKRCGSVPLEFSDRFISLNTFNDEKQKI